MDYKIDELQSIIDNLEKSIKDYNQSQENVQVFIIIIQNELNQYKNELNEKDKRIENITNDFNLLNNKYVNEIDEKNILLKENENYNKKIIELNNNNEEISNELSKYKNILQSIREISSK